MANAALGSSGHLRREPVTSTTQSQRAPRLHWRRAPPAKSFTSPPPEAVRPISLYVDTAYDPDSQTSHDDGAVQTAQDVLAAVLANTGTETSAHETLRRAHHDAESWATLHAEYQTLAQTAQADRWNTLLAHSGLTDQQVEQVRSSGAHGPLLTAFRDAESRGLDLEISLPGSCKGGRLQTPRTPPPSSMNTSNDGSSSPAAAGSLAPTSSPASSRERSQSPTRTWPELSTSEKWPWSNVPEPSQNKRSSTGPSVSVSWVLPRSIPDFDRIGRGPSYGRRLPRSLERHDRRPGARTREPDRRSRSGEAAPRGASCYRTGAPPVSDTTPTRTEPPTRRSGRELYAHPARHRYLMSRSTEPEPTPVGTPLRSARSSSLQGT